jgi:hypothetical protein
VLILVAAAMAIVLVVVGLAHVRRPWLRSPHRGPGVVMALLIGTATGATILAYQVVARLTHATPTWMIRFSWLLLSVAGIVAGALVSRRGAAILAQTATGVAAVAVGLLGRAIGTALQGPDQPLYLDLRWGRPPGLWSVTLLIGCVVIGVGAELGFAATSSVGRVWMAVVVAAVLSGAAELVFIRALGWLDTPEREAADLLVGLSVLAAVLLGWPAAMTEARLRRRSRVSWHAR